VLPLRQATNPMRTDELTLRNLWRNT